MFLPSRPPNLGYWAQSAAIQFPDRIAIHDWVDGRQRSLTHAWLEAELNTVAVALTRGFSVGQRIAVGIGNRAEFIAVFFGAMRAGLVPVPLNLRQGRLHLAHVLKDSGAVAAIIESGTNPNLPQLVEDLDLPLKISLGKQRSGWITYEEMFIAAHEVLAPLALPEGHPAMQPYTSGSTGRPKGVVLTHSGQLWWAETYARLYPPSPDEISLVPVPLYHKNAMAGVIKTRLPGGAAVVLMPQFDARLFLHHLARFRCTHATGVPAIYSLALRETDLLESLDFSALRSLSVGSAPVHDELLASMEKAFRCRVFESYGSTEGGPVMFGPPTDGTDVPLGSCGMIWPGCEARLVAVNGEEPSVGELLIRNPGVMSSYHALPEMTAAHLVDGWYKTGDLFEVNDDGFWFFRGRSDDMFICGGENIFPKEVEDILLRHPAVRDACVVPVPHPVKGQIPIALVVASPGNRPAEKELRQFCLANGPAFAHPRHIVFVDTMPLNGVGKVDRASVERNLNGLFRKEDAP